MFLDLYKDHSSERRTRVGAQDFIVNCVAARANARIALTAASISASVGILYSPSDFRGNISRRWASLGCSTVASFALNEWLPIDFGRLDDKSAAPIFGPAQRSGYGR
jgi:hypothetical protein